MPIYALNQVSEERCEWLVPGMLKDKVLALREEPAPAAALAPGAAAGLRRRVRRTRRRSREGGLLEALLKAVRERTQLAVQRNDFKLEQLPPHLFMNFRVVDEHGRQLGIGRNLAALKAELGGQARSAFQALAALKLPAGGTAPRRAGRGAPPAQRAQAGRPSPRRPSSAGRAGSAGRGAALHRAGPSASCPS